MGDCLHGIINRVDYILLYSTGLLTIAAGFVIYYMQQYHPTTSQCAAVHTKVAVIYDIVLCYWLVNVTFVILSTLKTYSHFYK